MYVDKYFAMSRFNIFFKIGNGQEVQCCNADGSTPNNLPKECLQIRIPRDDPGSKKRCLSVPRAADTSDLGCQIKPVRQVSIVQ